MNFVLNSVDYSRSIFMSIRTFLSMIFLCPLIIYTHSIESNMLWTIDSKETKRARRTSEDLINICHRTRIGGMDGTFGSDRTSSRLNNSIATSCTVLCTCASEHGWMTPATSDGYVVILEYNYCKYIFPIDT